MHLNAIKIIQTGNENCRKYSAKKEIKITFSSKGIKTT
jgi:hypothetical protein